MKKILPLIIFISILLYINTLCNTFVYDDVYIITENYLIKTLKNLPRLFQKEYLLLSGELSYRPVVTLTYFIDHAIWKINPFGYHLTNIILHTINVFLFYRFVRNISKSFIFSALAALLFLSHPILTETVNAVCYREDILASLFSLLAIQYFAKIYSAQLITPRSVFFLVLSCALYCLALFSKEMAVTLPMLLVLFNLFYTSRPISDRSLSKTQSIPHTSPIVRLKRWAFLYTGYILITGFYLFVRFAIFKNVFKTIETYPNNIFTMTKVVASYLKLVFLPIQLNADYCVPREEGISPSFILSSLLITTAGIIIIRLYRQNKQITFFNLWFFITLVPVLGIIPIGNIMAERYLYFPIIGFCGAAGCIVTKYTFQKKGIPIIAMGVILLGMQVWVIYRNGIWRDDTALWTSTYKREPNSARACSNLGNAYFKDKRYEDAISMYQKSLTFSYSYPFIHFNLGAAYEKLGLITKAIEEYKASISKNNDNTLAFNNLGTIYDKQGLYDLAIESYKQALASNPYSPLTHNNLGNTYEHTGNSEQALAEYITAGKIDSNYADAHNNAGAIYLKKGMVDRAIDELKKTIQLKPEHRDAHYNLGIAYAVQGLYVDAINEMDLATKYNANDYAAYRDLGLLYFKYKRDVKQSLSYLDKSLQLAPNPAEAKKVTDIIHAINSEQAF